MNRAPINPNREHPSSPDAEQCHLLVEKIVVSEHLRRSSRLTEFLRYVCNQTLDGHGDQLSEQEIGTVIFDRPPGYDTSADNIVRVNATELRKRIELYFAEEGRTDPILLAIPRGAYKPVFQFRPQKPADDARPSPIAPPVHQTEDGPVAKLLLTESRFSWKLVAEILTVSCLLLAASCIWLICANGRLKKSLAPWTASPELRSFWGSFLQENTDTDVILADTTFALVEDIAKHPIQLNDYLSGDYVRQLSDGNSVDRQEDLMLIRPRSFGSLGDFRLAQKILTLAPQAKNLHLYYAREYRPELLKNNNVILIGSRKSNPWGDLFQNQLNFTVEYDPISKVSSVRNHHPQAGEQTTYSTDTSDAGPSEQTSDGYSVIACLSNASSKTSALIIAGTNAPATEAAGELLTSESRLSELRQRMGLSKLSHFEVLLKTSQVSGTPINAKILAFRSLPK
ncbi:hypothetical protein ACOBR2_11115 [Telmatobacter bradus]|uniref:hypothetical protein n=1 Tax=Telmatobacter bradus TaxID=474953 RepID=UPI003B436A52